MQKVLGYILSVLGIISLALTLDIITVPFKIALPSYLDDITLTITGVLLAGAGMYIILWGEGKGGPREVPIYHGRQIIGYRTVK